MINQDDFQEEKKAFQDICSILSPPRFSLKKTINILQKIYLLYLTKGLEKETFDDLWYKERLQSIKDIISDTNTQMLEKNIKKMHETLKKGDWQHDNQRRERIFN